MRTRLLAILPLLFAQSLAAEPGAARIGLESFSEGLETLNASFIQLVTGPDGQLESEGEGEVWLKRPGLFRWAYGGDFPELIVADGEQVWLYDPALEQVTVKPQSGLADDSPLMLLTDLDALDEQFNVRELGEVDGVDLLELESVNTESEFDRVMLGFRDQGLVMMLLEDAFGLRTEVRFSGIARNPELADELFRFEPPEGTDIVGGADEAWMSEPDGG